MQKHKAIISDFFTRHGISTNSSFLIACSGGIDSIVLSELLVREGFQPALAHCNFQLRGDAADGDQKFVEKYANKHGLQFFTRNFETEQYSQQHGISIQMAARDLRYGFFRELMDDHHFNYLLTAHHADDSLETILLNLGRGTGLPGLSGIPPIRENILRPLLGLTKDAIIELANELNLEWREDASNTKTDYQRNYLRHKVISNFKENFPGFDKSFSKTQEQLQNDNALFQELLKEKINSIETESDQHKVINIPKLMQIPGYRSLLHYWLQPCGYFDLDAILSCLKGESGKVFANQEYTLLINRDQLILKPNSELKSEVYKIYKEDQYLSEPIELELKTEDASGLTIPQECSIATLDKDKLAFPLTLRKWQKGDFFFPLGMKGRKKLSDFFNDQKLSLFDKENIWILLSGNDIVWIVNHRIDDRFKISDTTKTVYFARLI